MIDSLAVELMKNFRLRSPDFSQRFALDAAKAIYPLKWSKEYKYCVTLKLSKPKKYEPEPLIIDLKNGFPCKNKTHTKYAAFAIG